MNDVRFQIVGANHGPAAAPLPAAPRAKPPLVSIALLALIVLGCLFAGALTAADPSYMDLTNCNRAPCAEFRFGTDAMGRDVFAMIWHGGRVSLYIGVVATLISTGIAILYGALSGMAHAWLDTLLMRFAELLLSVPSLLTVIFVQALLGQASATSIAVVIGVTGWMSVAKVVRTEVRRIRSSEYVVASRCMGGGFLHVLRYHLAPNFLSSIMFMVVMNIRGAIMSESTLSFLGIGLPLEIISWGSMLSLSEKAMLTGAWWVILIPGAFLVMTLVCISNIGNFLRRNANPRARNL